MLELYVAYKDYTWMAELLEGLLVEVVMAVNGSLHVKRAGGEINFTPPFRRATMLGLIQEYTGENVETMSDDELRALASRNHIKVEPAMGRAKLIDELFSERVQPHLVQPTFVMDHPVEMVPLAKRHRSKPGLVEAWELIVAGMELAPAFSELNDPRDQRQRFIDQAGLRAAGDDEAMLIDEDFLHALEVGMPPTAGMGLGIDRLVGILTGEDSIRDVVFFPMMRPETPEDAAERVAAEGEKE
jgi:lysyl-tRNA synthetase class 2